MAEGFAADLQLDALLNGKPVKGTSNKNKKKSEHIRTYTEPQNDSRL